MKTYACIPHARGDGPDEMENVFVASGYSPRTWGWTSNTMRPTPESVRIPHARGDGPSTGRPRPRHSAYSPRTWGWTANRQPLPRRASVFPTHVGMDRPAGDYRTGELGIPHARGDGPPNGTIGPIEL